MNPLDMPPPDDWMPRKGDPVWVRSETVGTILLVSTLEVRGGWVPGVIVHSVSRGRRPRNHTWMVCLKGLRLKGLPQHISDPERIVAQMSLRPMSAIDALAAASAT